MGMGETGVLCYVDANGKRVVVSADNPAPVGVRLFVSMIVSK